MDTRISNPGIPLEDAPEELQAFLQDHAATYRQRFGLPVDAPMRVVLPEEPETEAFLFPQDNFITADEGKMDLGL